MEWVRYLGIYEVKNLEIINFFAKTNRRRSRLCEKLCTHNFVAIQDLQYFLKFLDCHANSEYRIYSQRQVAVRLCDV